MLSRISTVFVCALLIGSALPAAASVTIHVLDVGQGDATLVVSSSGQTLLFDGGPNGQGTSTVTPYLTGLGITELDYMVASHYHADHIGGLDEVFAQVGVATAAYDRGWSYTTATYSTYATVCGPKRQTITDDLVIDLGDGVTATCIAVNGNGQVGSPYSSSTLENEYCVALHVECGDFDYFQAGDLTGGGGSYLDIETSVGPEMGDMEVYKVNHHGSYSSSNSAFLAATTPEVSIISMSSTNSYGHPHQDVLDRLVAYGSYVYQTTEGNGGTLPPADLTVVGGHIVIATDGTADYTVDGDTWSMDEISSVAPDRRLVLHGNAPNPFNPSTRINLTSAEAGDGLLEIFDAAGRRVWRRDFEVLGGDQSLVWRGIDQSGRQVPSGPYFYRVSTAREAVLGRMTLLK